MQRAVTVALFVLAWTIGPVTYIHDGPIPPTAPQPSVTTSR